MSDKNEKYYTPQEAAVAIFEKCKELYKNNTLAKANTAHELEPGSEPNNDDAEAPEQLQAGEVCKEGSFSSDKKKDKKKDKDEEGEKDESTPEHEEGMSEEENKEHDAAENDADEKDSDKIEADEEPEAKKADAEHEEDEEKKENKKKDKDMEKSLFKDKAVKCVVAEHKKTKEDVFYDIRVCIEKLQKMKELKWTIENEAPEAKNVFEKEFTKEKAKIAKLVKKYNSLKKSEETDEEISVLKKAERVMNDKPTTLKNFMKQKALKKSLK